MFNKRSFTRTIATISSLTLSFIWLSLPLEAQPAAYLEKVFSTPDLTQTDVRGNFAEGGKNYCAPVAVSNSFVWLAENGYPNLLPTLPKSEDVLSKQIKLVKILSSPQYMDTLPDQGTEVNHLLLGVKNYILQGGYKTRKLSYQGFRLSDAEFDSGLRHPRLSWLKKGLLGKSGVWLNLGWYKFVPETGTYIRLGGHWITMVGYGINEDNQPANNILIAHNPSPLAGSAFHNDFLRLEKIESGVLVSRKGLRGFPRPAIGFYKITSGLPPIHGCNTAILEGAVILELD